MLVQKLAKRFVPLQDLQAEKLRGLARSAKTIRLSLGDLVFDMGDTSPYSYYLVEGELQLTTRDGSRLRLHADDEQAAYPVGNLLPRQMRARIHSETAKLLRIHRHDLERAMGRDPGTARQPGMAIHDLSGIPEDLLDLLDMPLFSRLPRANCLRLFEKFEAVSYRSGDVVIREGEPGRYFYLVRRGGCRVSRRSDGRAVELNRLRALDSFGESALITGQPRGATVTMDSDGELLRLGRRDFLDLLLQPLLSHTPADKALQLAESGRARIIDIRSERKYARGHLAGARSIPTYLLYLKRNSLSRQRHYIIHSDSSRQSRAAAFMLLQRGLKVSVLGRTGQLSTRTVLDALIRPGAQRTLCA